MTVTAIRASAHDTGLPDHVAHLLLTSVPYYAKRQYADPEYQAIEWPEVEYRPMAGAGVPTIKIPAMRCELGNEPTLPAYIGHLVLCVREWRRVCRLDAPMLVNIGDTLNGSGGAGGDYNAGGIREGQPKYRGRKERDGLKDRDWMMVPTRFALAVQADADFARIRQLEAEIEELSSVNGHEPPTDVRKRLIKLYRDLKREEAGGLIVRSDIIWAKGTSLADGYTGACPPEPVVDRPVSGHEHIFLLAQQPGYFWDWYAVGNGARLRDVWLINQKGYAGAHFAPWPERLVETIILSGTSARGCCGACGAQHERMVGKDADSGYVSLGWEPGCECDAGDPVPATVFDPFAGSGTTGRVAERLGRNSILIDVSPTYVYKLMPERLAGVQKAMVV